MIIRLWGVRGTSPTPEKDKMKTGGNTACIEVELDDESIVILDAGSGIIPLGRYLVEKYKKLPPIYIFLTHTHWDHLQGFPLFKPLFQQGAVINIYAPRKTTRNLEEIMQLQMSDDFWPVDYEHLPCFLNYFDIDEKPIILPNGLSVTPAKHIHPGGAYSYRLEYKGKVFVLNTDTEHYISHLDERVVDISKGADLMIHDAQYTEQEMPYKVGWGHSTWNQAIETAQKAGVKKLGFFHHDPERTDKEINALEKKAQKVFENSFFCREGMEIKL